MDNYGPESIAASGKLLVNRIRGNLGTGPHMDGFATNQALTTVSTVNPARMQPERSIFVYSADQTKPIMRKNGGSTTTHSGASSTT